MPTTRSSSSKKASKVDNSTSFDSTDDESSCTIKSSPVPIEDCDLKTLMLSIQANQKLIEALTSRLTEHSITLETNSGKLIDLDDTVQAVRTAVETLLKSFDEKLNIVKEDLRSTFATASHELIRHQDLQRSIVSPY
jgi:hypothetical protein